MSKRFILWSPTIIDPVPAYHSRGMHANEYKEAYQNEIMYRYIVYLYTSFSRFTTSTLTTLGRSSEAHGCSGPRARLRSTIINNIPKSVQTQPSNPPVFPLSSVMLITLLIKVPGLLAGTTYANCWNYFPTSTRLKSTSLSRWYDD